MIVKTPRYENRRLLDLVKNLPCQNCGADDGTIVPAHANGQEYGKGGSRKSDDEWHSALCFRCHTWLDQGGISMDPSGFYRPTKDDKHEMWWRAHVKTFSEYWRRGYLSVIGP